MSFLSSSTKSNLKDSKNQISSSASDISNEFKSFLSDVEDLVKSTASLSGDDLAKAKSKLNQRIAVAKESIGEASVPVIQQVRKTAASTDNYIREQPWTALGAGVAISFLLGFLLAGRRD